MLTSEFIRRVRQMVQLPNEDQDWTDEEILEEGTLALRERFVQVIANARQGYWLKEEKWLTNPGQAYYRLPPRATVQGLELLEIATSGGDAYPYGPWRQLNIATPSQTTTYSSPSQNFPGHFEIRGDMIVLHPTPAEQHWLRMRYYLRPSVLVLEDFDTTSPMQRVFGSTNQQDGTWVLELEFDANPFSAGDEVDIIQTTGSNEVLIVSTVIDNDHGPGSPLVDVREVFPGQLDPLATDQGDGTLVMITPDQTPVIPLPLEMHSALVAWVSAVILTDRGDMEKAASCAKKAEAAIERLTNVMTPRIKAQPYTFKTKNTYLRRRQAWGWGRW